MPGAVTTLREGNNSSSGIHFLLFLSSPHMPNSKTFQRNMSQKMIMIWFTGQAEANQGEIRKENSSKWGNWLLQRHEEKKE